LCGVLTALTGVCEGSILQAKVASAADAAAVGLTELHQRVAALQAAARDKELAWARAEAEQAKLAEILEQSNAERRRLEAAVGACTCEQAKATAATQAAALDQLQDEVVSLETQLAAAKLEQEQGGEDGLQVRVPPCVVFYSLRSRRAWVALQKMPPSRKCRI
jgi:hypothetical protein